MDKKSFLFGLGVGLILLAVIVYASNGFELKDQPTDAVVTATPTPPPDYFTIEPTPEPTVAPTVEPTPEPTVEPTPEPTPEAIDEPTPEPTDEPANSVAPVFTPEGIQLYARVTIVYGDSASDISNKLAASGIVGDADDFCNYLIEQGMTTKLITGTFDLPIGGDYSELLRILQSFSERVNY